MHRQIIVPRLIEHLTDQLQQVHAVVALEYHPRHDLNHVTELIAVNQIRQSLLFLRVVCILQAIDDLLESLGDQRQEHRPESFRVDVDFEQNDQVVGDHSISMVGLKRIRDVGEVAVLLRNEFSRLRIDLAKVREGLDRHANCVFVAHLHE